MTTDSEEIIKKSKTEKLKNKVQKKSKKRSLEDDDKMKKKKKIKKEKKKDLDISKTEEDDLDDLESTEENIDDDGEVTKAKKEPSKRQLKREKAEQRALEIKQASKLQAAQKALNYVSKWKHAKSEWKFEKVKQIWLINNLFDEDYIPDDHFNTVLEYFEGCKGLAKKQLVDKAMAIIKKIEDSIEEDEEIVETSEYKRARKLLQALPTET